MNRLFKAAISIQAIQAGLMALALSCHTLPAWSKTVRWAAASDITTWDIHSQVNGFQSGVHAAVYESLVYFNSRTFKPEPMLATSWKMVTPQQWRFTLRQGVKFHDGSDFNADDVVFSLRRAMAKTSTFTAQVASIAKVEKVDNFTVDVWTQGSDPVLLAQLTELRIMSKAWAQANDSLEPKDINSNQDTPSHRQANGTGPYMLKDWVPRQKFILVKNPKWWGKMEGNVTEVVYTPIRSDTARINALQEQSIDLLQDPNPQDLYRVQKNDDLKVVTGPETRTIMLGMDQFRNELVGSNIKGRNPLKDVRVRRALYQAIDIDSLHEIIMRQQSQNTGALVSPQINGWTEKLHARLPFSTDAAKKMLSQAGYPEGFTVDFACPAGRYVNDSEICQAISSMWSKVGIKTRLRIVNAPVYLPMMQRHEASIYLIGWGVTTFDALYTLQSLVRTPGAGGDGNYNLGRYSNPALDKLIDRAKTESDPTARTRLLTAALQLQSDEVAMIPLHNQLISWAMTKNVNLVFRADNRIDWRLVQVD
ncbi:ABC transporter substrate-binding protein [Limnohabitans sp. T6-5]|nr:ABC transporter substrate-binding protein [Limnohabitans sp. T6-5]